MLEKIKSFFKLHYPSIIIFIGIILVVSPVILSRYLNDLDEIWNYNFARNVADGLIPYRDFNMVPTPLLPFISGLILKLFGNELIVMRILAILLISSIFFMVYKILRKLNVTIFYNLACVFFLFMLLKNYICIDYNFAALFLTLILIYLELNHFIKNQESNSNYSLWYYFLCGFICGCCILFKQSTGVFITAASIFYPILFVKNKMDLKNYLKISFIKMAGIFIPVICLLIYLVCNHAFYDFIDYTILGIKTFSNSIPYTSLLYSKNIVIKILSILMPVFVLIGGVYLLWKKNKKLFGFYFYGIASLIVIYPISDPIHFLIGITPLFILLVYLLFELLKSSIDNCNINNITKIFSFLYELSKALLVLIFLCYMITSCLLLKEYFFNTDKSHVVAHYKGIPISEGLINKIDVINHYILSEDQPVYILDAEASIYMISVNRYHKDFDMFNKGNFGSQGEAGQIEKIKSLPSGTKLLIKNENYSLNWQTPMQVISFIRSNLNKIGEIHIFDIYEIN